MRSFANKVEFTGVGSAPLLYHPQRPRFVVLCVFFQARAEPAAREERVRATTILMCSSRLRSTFPLYLHSNGLRTIAER